jgi:replicative DNA helicase
MEALANRLPPQNEDAEKSVLGALMLDKNAIINVADTLEPNDFYQGKHKKVYEAMLDLYAKSEPIDILSLSNRLKEKKRLKDIGDRSYLAELVSSVPTAAHISHYAEIVHQKAVLRRLIDASAQITESAFNEQEELAVLIDKAEQSIFNISQRSSRQSFASLKPMLAEAFDRLDTLSKGGGALRGLATGFLDLDNKLSGLQNSDLIIIAARPSLGKSTLALDIARNVALVEKKPVGIFSLEMSKDQLTDRLLCASGNVPLWKFRTGRLHDNDFQNINRAIATLSDAPIFIDDSSATNIMQIRTMCRRLQSEHGLGLVVIDYLQLMEGSTKTDNRVQEISEISRSLKMLARELDVPILALSQLSRAVEQRGGHPKLSDLRESGSIEQDSDIVMFIYREDKEKRDSQRKNIADIIVAKHRNGPTGSLPLYFNEEVVSFKNLEKHHHGTTQETPAPNRGTPEVTGSGPESGLENGLLDLKESELPTPGNN